MLNLYMITLGGKAPGALIEVHDVQFIIAKNIEETYSVLKENWYGLEFKLHLDSYRVVNGADGHSISISTETADTSNSRLYFVNMGGYDAELMRELHSYHLVVSTNIDEAKNRSLELFSGSMKEPHIDNISLVSEAKLLNSLYKGEISLHQNGLEYSNRPEWFGYKRVDVL